MSSTITKKRFSKIFKVVSVINGSPSFKNAFFKLDVVADTGIYISTPLLRDDGWLLKNISMDVTEKERFEKNGRADVNVMLELPQILYVNGIATQKNLDIVYTIGLKRDFSKGFWSVTSQWGVWGDVYLELILVKLNFVIVPYSPASTFDSYLSIYFNRDAVDILDWQKLGIDKNALYPPETPEPETPKRKAPREALPPKETIKTKTPQPE